MKKIVKIVLSLIFLAILQAAVSTYFTQIYGGVTVIPHSDLEADIFWLLLSCFGLLILIFLQLLFMAGGKKERRSQKRKFKEIVDEEKLRKSSPPRKKTRKAQKEHGKKQSKPESKADHSPITADESQAPGKEEYPKIWDEEEFE